MLESIIIETFISLTVTYWLAFRIKSNYKLNIAFIFQNKNKKITQVNGTQLVDPMKVLKCIQEMGPQDTERKKGNPNFSIAMRTIELIDSIEKED